MANRKTIILTSTIIILAAIITAQAINVYANQTIQGNLKPNLKWPWTNGKGKIAPRQIEVSEEYKQKVVSIAQNDPDIKNLINNGYNITAIKPIIKATIKADGTIELKASKAIITLMKSKTERATALVDLEQGKITKIIITTVTIIEKT